MTKQIQTVLGCVLATVSVAVFLVGCMSGGAIRMYTGPELPPEQVTTLIVPACIVVTSIDQASLQTDSADETRILLKPGMHHLVARYENTYTPSYNKIERAMSQSVALSFTGEAGKTYTVCSENPDTVEAILNYAAHVVLWIENGKVAPGHGHPPASTPGSSAK